MKHQKARLLKKTLKSSAFVISAALAVVNCSGPYNNYDRVNDPLDRASDLNRSDYARQLFPQNQEKVVETAVKAPPLPKAADVIATPSAPRLGVNKTVSLSVTEDVPLKDVFIELARLADVDIEVDPNITGGVIFKVKNRPFDEVVERICDLAGLRYSINNGVIRIEADSSYVETYQASFLNLIRKSTGNIDVNTKTLGSDSSSGSSGSGATSGSSTSGGNSSDTGSGGSGSNAAATGSQSSITSQSGGEGDLWSSIQKELRAIVGAGVTSANSQQNNSSSINGFQGQNTALQGQNAGLQGQVNLNSGVSSVGDSFVSLNREAGVLTVRTTAKNHKKVRQYLAKVKELYSSQVLIEAKVVEISLNDEFKSGVNWSVLTKHGNGIVINPGGFDTDRIAGGGQDSTIKFATGDLSGLVRLAQVFGTTKTLSSPRILVMNNQQAVLSFATNQNYFTISCQSNTLVGTAGSPGNNQASIESELHTIPIGIILGLQPSIDPGNNEVTLNVHPTLSRLTGRNVEDPAAVGCSALTTNGNNTTAIKSVIPQVDIREMDSILRLKSGETMAIGGMIDQKNNNTDSGVPVLSDVPFLGYAFKTVNKENTATQTVIFLKATIVPGYGVDTKDQEMYNRFNNDPRPLNF